MPSKKDKEDIALDKECLDKLAQRIKRLSEEKFETKIEFADACDVNRRTITRIINSEQNPSLFLLRRIAVGLEIELKELMDFEN